jgi:hypothetical protein
MPETDLRQEEPPEPGLRADLIALADPQRMAALPITLTRDPPDHVARRSVAVRSERA